MIPRRFPKLHNGFKVVKEDGTEETPKSWKHNGFVKVEVKSNVGEELPVKKEVPAKKEI